MHGSHDAQIRETLVSHLPGHEPVGDNADDVTASFENRISKYPHEPYAPAAVDKLYVACDERVGQLHRRLPIDRRCAGTGTAEHADTLEGQLVLHDGILGANRPRRSCGTIASR